MQRFAPRVMIVLIIVVATAVATKALRHERIQLDDRPELTVAVDAPPYPTPGDTVSLHIRVSGGQANAIEKIRVTGIEPELVIEGPGLPWDHVIDGRHGTASHTVAIVVPDAEKLRLAVSVDHVHAKPIRGTYEYAPRSEVVEPDAIRIYAPATALRYRIVHGVLAALGLVLACLAALFVPRVRRWIDDRRRSGVWLLGAAVLVVAYGTVCYAVLARSIALASGVHAMWFTIVVVVAWLALPAAIAALRFRRDGKLPPQALGLRPHEINRADPYRDELCEPRVVEPANLADVIAAIRAAGLPVRTRRDGFEVRRHRHWLRARTGDVRRIDPSTLAITTNSYDLHFELALALVPLFGPLAAEAGAAGWLAIDGLRDRAALLAALDAKFRRLAEAQQSARAV